MKVMVLSLGGSLMVPSTIDFAFLEQFRKTIEKYEKTHRFVIVCGGGSIARTYISALRSEGKSKKELSIAGIRATRMNALFLMQFFGKIANDSLPKTMLEVKNNLHKNKVVICGALRFDKNATSDTTAAKLAVFLKTPFINLTNVDGLYSANPKTHKKAKFIPKITWKDFESIAHKVEHQPGQHFVLDWQAATIIKNQKIPTYIIGKNLKNLQSALEGKPFKGTIIAH